MATGYSRPKRTTLLKRFSREVSHRESQEVVNVLYEGWCIKESGTQFLGKTNWKKRWFKLIQQIDNSVYLQYYKSKSDSQPVGTIKLDVTYCVCQMEADTKSYPNCFTVGPIIDDGATRTYFISCLMWNLNDPYHMTLQDTQDEMREWMTAIDAAIQGVPDKAEQRMRSASLSYRKRSTKKRKEPTRDPLLSPSATSDLSLDISMSTEYDERGWLDCNPDAKMELADLDKEECISDDETESSAGLNDDDDEEFERIVQTPRSNSLSALASLKPEEKLKCYADPAWRIQRWNELCAVESSATWSKIDRKNDVVISRCRFGRNQNAHAVIKVEGILPATPGTVYQFLQLSTQPGGKLDYIFRNETFLQRFEDNPEGEIIQNQFSMPLPRISNREVVAMKIWVPDTLTADDKSGFVMVSVDHPNALSSEKDVTKIHVNPSGFILTTCPGQDDSSMFTHACIIVQIALKSGLHQLMKGAYNSGLLKLGMRTTFNHIRQQLRKFMDIAQVSSTLHDSS